ncbi:MAG TPA: glutamate-cysteine ligase family protein [Pirellula sp.]|nr:glutamate-cysteine ligase family protein [Pirellula sp.]
MSAKMKPIWPAFSCYGIELEYMIVDRDRLDVRPISPDLIKLLERESAVGAKVGKLECSNEFVKHVIELKNVEPQSDLLGMSSLFQTEIGRLNLFLEKLSARLMPSGMHPWMNPAKETQIWDMEGSQLYRAYARVFDTETHGWANLQSIHINLPFLDEQEFVRLHAAIRLVLPLLPALAASSPIADGVLTGFADFRLEAYRKNAELMPSITGDIIPEAISSYEEYRQVILVPMYREMAAHDSEGMLQHEWLNSRGAIARFDRQSIEIRLLDSQECPAADLAIVAAVVSFVQDIYLCDRDLQELNAIPTEWLSAIFRQCVCEGECAVIHDQAYLKQIRGDRRPIAAGELWQWLFEKGPAMRATLANYRAPLEHIFNQGTLSRRLASAFAPDCTRANLYSIYLDLCDCLSEGRLYSATVA